MGAVDEANETALFDDGWMTVERQLQQNRERSS
jgi:hypothetical protein